MKFALKTCEFYCGWIIARFRSLNWTSTPQFSTTCNIFVGRPREYVTHFPWLSYKRNNAIASRRHGELLSATIYEIHSDSSPLFITVASYYSHFAKRGNATSWGTRPTLAFNRRISEWERIARVIIFSVNDRPSFLPFLARPRYVARVTLAGRTSGLAHFRARTHVATTARARAVFY